MSSDYRGRTDLDRGIRNNNPGNIKDDGTAWQGKVGADPTFIIFADMGWGTRAMAKSLTNMINGGLNTVDSLIRTWSTTDQDAYVANVAAALGVQPTDTITPDTPTLQGLIRAIVDQENGAQGSLVTDQDIADGLSRMGSTFVSAVQSAVVAVTNDPSLGISIAAGLLLIGVLVSSYHRRNR